MTILLYVLCFCGIVFSAISIITENPKFFIVAFVSLVLAWACVCMLPLPNKNPSKLYQEKVEAVEKANRELEIFLIEHPEFKGKE